MKRLRVRATRGLALAAALTLVGGLSGCSSSSISLIAPAIATPKVTPTPESTPVPRILAMGYDHFAGNCPDAANESIALISYAQSQNYNFDMQLEIAPTGGCGSELKTGAYHTFVTQVGQATLNMNALDTQWVYGYAPTREAFIDSVFAKLQVQYPSLSKVQVNVLYGGQIRATLTYTGHGQPVYQSLS
jgi:hypothetical protein